MITITPLGGGQEIGANSYLIKTGSHAVLLDAGMHPGYRDSQALMNLSRVPEHLDAVIISHAHYDHVGSLPYLFQERSVGRIYLTRGSAPIIKRMLRNTAATIREHYPQLWKLPQYRGYHRAELDSLFRFMSSSAKRYHEYFSLGKEVGKGSFFDAGHVLGSAGVVLNFTSGEVLVYTGDIALRSHGIHPGAQLKLALPRMDCLLIEATTAQEDRTVALKNEMEKLFNFLEDAQGRGGRVLIPAFALGRTQDMLAMIQHGRERGRLEASIPLYLVGLGNAITAIYDQQPGEYLNRLFSQCDRLQDIPQPLDFNLLIETYEEHRRRKEPALFIATNGMLEPGTPSATLAAQMVSHPEEMIIFPGYQAPRTLGRDLLNATPGTELDFKGAAGRIVVKTERIYQIRLSSHASRQELVNLVEELNPDYTMVVHGEPESTRWLVDQLRKRGREALAPRNGEVGLLYAREEMAPRSLPEITAVVVTVGTSLLRSWQNATQRKELPDKKRLLSYLQSQEKQSLKSGKWSSAEIQTLVGMGLKGNERLYFIVGESEEGRLCGEALNAYYNKRGWHGEVQEIPYLKVEFVDFQLKGLPNLVNTLADIIEAHQRNVRLVATGGYKAETAMAGIVGAFFNVPVYYVHEDRKSVITFTRLPLSPDFRLLGNQVINIEKALNASPAAKGWNIVRHNLPEALVSLFQEQPNGEGLELSPMGEIFMRLFQRYREPAPEGLERLHAKKMQPTLWGTGTVQVREIPDADLRLIMERMGREGDSVRKITLHQLDVKHKAPETHLEFLRIEKNLLIYKLCTPRGCQVMQLHCWPGIQEEVLKRLGRKIYA